MVGLRLQVENHNLEQGTLQIKSATSPDGKVTLQKQKFFMTDVRSKLAASSHIEPESNTNFFSYTDDDDTTTYSENSF